MNYRFNRHELIAPALQVSLTIRMLVGWAEECKSSAADVGKAMFIRCGVYHGAFRGRHPRPEPHREDH